MKLSTTGIVKSEPVIVAHAVAWLLLQAGMIVVGRYHLISGATWTAMSSALAPVITAVLLGALAWFIRRVVTPAWRFAEPIFGPVVGAITDAPAEPVAEPAPAA